MPANRATYQESPAKLRVLMLGPYPPPFGGVEISLVALRDYLLEAGYGCEVINLTRHCRENAAGVCYPHNACQVLWLLLRRSADIVHLHIGGDVRWRLLALGFLASLLPGRKVVLTLHSGGYPASPEGRAAKPFSLRGFFFRRFAGLIAVNQQIADLFLRFGVAPKRVRLILPFAMPAQVPKGPLPEPIESFFATHQPILLSVNGLEPEYRLLLQIDALGELRGDFPDAGLLIMGKGSLESQIRERIALTPYSRHILLAVDVPHQAVLESMSRAAVSLRTTLYDGDSIAVREALHFGLPVIATDTGMRPPGVILVPMSDPTALLQAIRQTLAAPRPPLMDRSGDHANLAAVVNFYEELCSPAELPTAR